MDKDYLGTRKHLVIYILLALQLNSIYVTSESYNIIGLFPKLLPNAESVELSRIVGDLAKQFKVSVGMELHDKCNDKGIAMQAMLEIFTQPNNFTAIIGPGSKETIQNVNLFLSAIPDKVLQLVHNPLITSHDYLQNTAPSVSLIVEILIDLMVKIKWNYIVIIRDSTEFSRLTCELFIEKAKKRRICIGLVEVTPENDDNENIFKKIINADINGILGLGKEDSIRAISRYVKINPDLRDRRFIFASNEICCTKGTNDDLPDLSIQVLWGLFNNKTVGFKYIHDSAKMAFTWFKRCQSLSDCKPLRHQELFNGTLNIFQKVKDRQIQVGTYTKELDLFPGTIKIEESFCRKECEKCRILDTIPNAYKIKTGTKYIVLLLPVHAPAKEDLFSCSQTLRLLDSVDLIEAARFSIKTSVNPDVGLIIVDSCVKALVTIEQIISFNYTNIIGVVGGYYSLTTIPAAEILTRLQIPHISYAAESHVLSDRSRFPNFQTTSISLNRSAKTIILLCKRMGWKAINIMYNNEAYGISGHSLLVKFAKIYGICIVNDIKVELGEKKFHKYLNQLRKTSKVKIVINIMLRESKEDWLSVLNEDIEDNEFLFIMTYKLSDVGIKKIKERHFKNHLVLEPKKLTNKEFKDYYTNLKESNIKENPWAKEFIEKIYKCHFEGSFNINYKEICKYKLKMDSVSEYHDLLIKAIYALLNGTKAFKEKSGSNKDDVKKITEEIRKTRFNISGKEQRLFDHEGFSQIQIFHLERVKTVDPVVTYETMAEYDDGIWHSGHWDELSFTSRCESDDSCTVCSVEEDETIYEVFIALDVILALIILAIIAFIIWKKKNALRRCMNIN